MAKTPVKQYLEKHPSETKNFTHSVLETLESGIVSIISDLIDQEILYVLDGNEESVKKQLDIYKKVGAVDVVNASIANLFGTSFLTVDAKLARNMKEIEHQLPNIKNIYYTAGIYRDY